MESVYYSDKGVTIRNAVRVALATGPSPAIRLTSEQERLFARLVDAARSQKETYTFGVFPSTFSNPVSIRLSDGNELPVEKADLTELSRKNLIVWDEPLGDRHGDRHMGSFHIPQEGFDYYDKLWQQRAEPVKEAAHYVRTLVNEQYAKAYPEAVRLLHEAGQLLGSARSQEDYSAIGHKCREAVQEFSQQFYERYYSNAQREPLVKDRTVEKVKKVLNEKKVGIGDTTAAFLEQLLGFWGTVLDIVEKVEHRSQREGRPLTWDDARRAFLYSYLVIGELEQALQSCNPQPNK